MKWIKIEEVIPLEDFVRTTCVGRRKITLLRHVGILYALQNDCPHAGGILGGGWCKDGFIVCPIHRREYSLKNGRGAPGQGDCIDLYPIEEREDGVYVGLNERLWERIFG
jgi:3-phenylpropionate/trans-cinnamate dioxygenase ferredoxin subunit